MPLSAFWINLEPKTQGKRQIYLKIGFDLRIRVKDPESAKESAILHTHLFNFLSIFSHVAIPYVPF